MAGVTEPAGQRPYHHGNLRSAILEAAARHLREHGADQLSLRDLAREIGVSHAAPRRHFTDRQALLDALAETGFVQLGGALRTSLAEAGDSFAARVHNAVSAFAHFATENAALLELMNSGKHRPGATRIVDAAEAAFGQMVELIKEGQEHGVLERGDTERIGIILYATVQGITTMVNGGMVDAEKLDELVEAAVEHFLRGARPRVR
ncbi:TetR/AcrR family transcriptional regulator [Actinorugispora endophytica]|uniref:TetR family transcriptional regulator n=1 Tax=Actinorugispora endophytica TaxID=1605990 RepID=A0A4R6UH04_9ACTN|nr:TetR/AcrR family transcriptional regulator [Actinorugispora endophytica]TDQ46098.1 TetR family transcriptional regulator [Actinorugispora endophytica]